MAEIPAPLANRHTAAAVVVVSLLGASTATASALLPDEQTIVWLLVARQLVFAAQAAVIAVAVVLVGRTLVKRSRVGLLGTLLALGGLLLLAATRLVAILLVTPWHPDPDLFGILLLASAVATAVGMLVLGVGVLRHGVWRGPTRFTLLVAVLLIVAGAFLVPPVYVLLSLVLIGLASGLSSRRTVANAGVQQGAALVEQPPSA